MRAGDERLEVALVHRPQHDDWSLPKGKAEAKESDEQCALREVAEETGFICEIGVLLGSVEYQDAKGRRKVSRYFLMRPLMGEFAPNAEVDELCWLPVPEAADRLTYADDRRLLDELPTKPLATAG